MFRGAESSGHQARSDRRGVEPVGISQGELSIVVTKVAMIEAFDRAAGKSAEKRRKLANAFCWGKALLPVAVASLCIAGESGGRRLNRESGTTWSGDLRNQIARPAAGTLDDLASVLGGLAREG